MTPIRTRDDIVVLGDISATTDDFIVVALQFYDTDPRFRGQYMTDDAVIVNRTTTEDSDWPPSWGTVLSSPDVQSAVHCGIERALSYRYTSILLERCREAIASADEDESFIPFSVIEDLHYAVEQYKVKVK